MDRAVTFSKEKKLIFYMASIEDSVVSFIGYIGIDIVS